MSIASTIPGRNVPKMNQCISLPCWSLCVNCSSVTTFEAFEQRRFETFRRAQVVNMRIVMKPLRNS